jgi:hypothetical protein
VLLFIARSQFNSISFSLSRPSAVANSTASYAMAMIAGSSRRRFHSLGLLSITFLFLIFILFIIFVTFILTQPSKIYQPLTIPLTTDFQIDFKQSTVVLKEKPILNKPINGIFFIAHACTHSAYDFWPKSGRCPDCVGLAEEVEIVRSAISQNFYVIAISSLDRQSGCWGMDDLAGVVTILEEVKRSFPSHLPLFGLGCSSGGTFLWKLFQYLEEIDHPLLRIDGMIIQSMALPIAQPPLVPQLPPPIIFNPMPRDQSMYESVLHNNHSLVADHRYPSLMVHIGTCSPLPCSPEFISSRLWYLPLTLQEAQTINSLLRAHNYLNLHDDYLIKDPTNPTNNWRDLLVKNLSPETMAKIDLTPGKSPLAKVLNRCWAFHEYCADEIKENLLWMKYIRYRQKNNLPLVPQP